MHEIRVYYIVCDIVRLHMRFINAIVKCRVKCLKWKMIYQNLNNRFNAVNYCGNWIELFNNADQHNKTNMYL